MLNHVPLFAIPWTIACWALLSMVFPRQEYWRGLPSPSPGHLPDPGMELRPLALADRFFTTEPPGKPNLEYIRICKTSWQKTLIKDIEENLNKQRTRLSCGLP